MAEIYDLDDTAANNNAAPPEGAPEGMSYSALNNTLRELMAKISRYINSNAAIGTTGTGNDYLLTVPQTITSYTTGMRFSFSADRSSVTGPVTLKVNTAPTVAVVRNDNTALATAGDIAAGSIVEVIYNGTSFVMTVPVGNVISETEGNLHYIRLDGTSTTSGLIPFAAGVTITGVLTTQSNSPVFKGTLDNTPSSGGNQDAKLILANDSGTSSAEYGFDASPDLTMRNLTDGGNVRLTGRQNDSSPVLILQGDPDAATTINHPGADESVLSTTTRTAGGVLVNNGLSGTGTTAQRVLTTSDYARYARSAVENSVSANGGINQLTNMVFSLRANTVYRFEFHGGFRALGGFDAPILGLGVRYTGTNAFGSYSVSNTFSGFSDLETTILSSLSIIATGFLETGTGIPRYATIHGIISTTTAGDLEFKFGSTNTVASQVVTDHGGGFGFVEAVLAE